MPENLAEIIQPLESIARKERLCLHQGVPLVPILPWPLYALYWLVLAPPVIGFCLLNAPALAVGFVASRKLPDAPNVIAFWRMAAGLPVGVVWAALSSTASALVYGLAGFAIYWCATIAGIGAWYRFRKLTVALCNGLFHADTIPALLHTYRELKDQMPNSRNV